MPFNVATIKDKAISAKNATVTKVQDTRDRHSSTPMARTRFADAGYVPKGPPPPPPPGSGPSGRSSFNSSRGSLDRVDSGDGQAQGHAYGQGPPPVLRSTKPSLSANSSASLDVERSSSTSPPPTAAPSRGLSVLQRAKAFGAQASPTSPPPAPRPPSQSQRLSYQIPKPPQVISPAATGGIDKIDWANLPSEDKQVFFGWLDEFFARYIEKMRGVHLESGETEADGVKGHGNESFVVKVEPPPAPPASDTSIVAGRGPPPPIRSWSRPAIETIPSPSSHNQTQSQTEFTSSYPPPTTHGSQALDLAHFFHPSTHWPSPPWYASPNAVPPPLQTNPHRLYKAQMYQRADSKSISFGVLFCDLSSAWVSISFSASTNRETERTAKYLPPPGPMEGEELRRESEMYGETIASYAESFLGSGQFCARGECWDLASEALKFITSEYSSQGIPAPIPSLGRTHGHLIYVGKASKGMGGGGRGARQEGRWRGGDDRVRRGDIVEWRSVRIARVGDPPGGWAILGDPEHTAIVTRDTVPSPFPSSRAVYDGASLEPRDLGTLEVVEQSRNDPPEPVKRVYDLSRFEEGEVWIYRPVAMSAYLGFGELVCDPPDEALSL